MDKIRFGIIGCGRIAQRHAKHIKSFGELVSAYDEKANRAQALVGQFGGTAFDSYEEFIVNSHADVIAVCSPNGLHAKHSIDCLNAGYNVICEKPMAIRSEDCQRMIEVSQQSGKKLFVVKQNRYNPAISALKGKVDAGDLGEILSVQLNCFWNRNDKYYQDSDWKGSQQMDGGTLFTQFSHFVDLLYWMLGDIEEVQGYKQNSLHQGIIDFEDSGVLSMKFKNGVIGTVNYTVNSFDKNMEGSITLFGTKGTVKVGGQYLNNLDYQEWEGEPIGALEEGNPANEYGDYQGSMSNHDKVYSNVVDVLLNGGKIATTGEEGKKVVEMIEQMYISMR